MTAQKFRFVLIGIIVLTLGASGAIGYFGVTFLHDEVVKAREVKIDADVNRQAQTSALIAEQTLSDPQIAKLSDYLKKVIPKDSYRNQFIADVNKYAAESGVPLQSLSYTATSSAAPRISGATPVGIQLSMGKGIPYNQFISFVKKLEDNLQHIQVLSITMQPDSENRTVLSSASLTIVLYVEN